MNNNTKKNNSSGNNLGNSLNKLNNKINKPLQNNTRTNSSSQQGTGSTGYTGSNVFGIVILIVVIIAIGSAAYWLYNYYTTKSFQTSIDVELMPDIKDATGTTNLASGTIPSSSFSNEYSISCWINVQDYNYNYGKEKVILRRGKAGSGNPEIILDAKNNNLIVRVKLQNTGNTSSVSHFQDIPIQLKLQNVGLGFITPESVDNIGINTDMNNKISSNDTDSLNIPESFKKIGSNNIDYPTIHYTIDNNRINTDSTQCGYFDLISGNTLNTNPNVITSNGNHLVEGFTNIDDAVNATVAVVVDMCNIQKTIQGQQLADDNVTYMNNSYQTIINSLEANRSVAKSGNDVTKLFSTISSDISDISIIKANTELEQQFTTLINDMEILATFSNVQVDYNTIIKAVNAKMATINCPLTFDGTSEVDGTTSFYENIINLLKKSMMTYINNMSSGIQKIYPELASKQSATCLIDNNANTDPTVGTCMVKMIPLQKWVNIIVSVYNQIIDIYIDGLLSSSCVLKGFPAISTDDANITPDGGFSGKIARVVFSNTAMTVKHAKDIYYSGPVASTSLFAMIPNWVYWSILIIIIIAIGYSFMM